MPSINSITSRWKEARRKKIIIIKKKQKAFYSTAGLLFGPSNQQLGQQNRRKAEATEEERVNRTLSIARFNHRSVVINHHVVFFSCLFSGPPLASSSLGAALLRPLHLLRHRACRMFLSSSSSCDFLNIFCWFFFMGFTPFLQVSVPCSSLFKTVTVRCGHCTNLLSVNMRGLLLPAANQLGHAFLSPAHHNLSVIIWIFYLARVRVWFY